MNICRRPAGGAGKNKKPLFVETYYEAVTILHGPCRRFSVVANFDSMDIEYVSMSPWFCFGRLVYYYFANMLRSTTRSVAWFVLVGAF